MAHLLINYSLSYDWLVRGRPEKDWRPVYEAGMRYQAALAHVRAALPDEDKTVQYHLITCTLQRAVLMQTFPDRWRSMIAPGRGHPPLDRTWTLIEGRAATIDWRDPLTSLRAW